MPAKDLYHHAVKCALIKDGWAILAEDYALTYGSDRVYADIAAEKAITAERNNQRNQVKLIIIDPDSEVIEQWIQ